MPNASSIASRSTYDDNEDPFPIPTTTRNRLPRSRATSSARSSQSGSLSTSRTGSISRPITPLATTYNALKGTQNVSGGAISGPSSLRVASTNHNLAGPSGSGTSSKGRKRRRSLTSVDGSTSSRYTAGPRSRRQRLNHHHSASVSEGEDQDEVDHLLSDLESTTAHVGDDYAYSARPGGSEDDDEDDELELGFLSQNRSGSGPSQTQMSMSSFAPASGYPAANPSHPQEDEESEHAFTFMRRHYPRGSGSHPSFAFSTNTSSSSAAATGSTGNQGSSGSEEGTSQLAHLLFHPFDGTSIPPPSGSSTGATIGSSHTSSVISDEDGGDNDDLSSLYADSVGTGPRSVIRGQSYAAATGAGYSSSALPPRQNPAGSFSVAEATSSQPATRSTAASLSGMSAERKGKGNAKGASSATKTTTAISGRTEAESTPTITISSSPHQASSSSASSSFSTPEPAPSKPSPEPLSQYTCPICFFPPTNATITPCGHICCGQCLFTAIKTTMARGIGYGIGLGVGGGEANCPVCRAVIPGWDGRGGGVIGLKVRTVFSI